MVKKDKALAAVLVSKSLQATSIYKDFCESQMGVNGRQAIPLLLDFFFEKTFHLDNFDQVIKEMGPIVIRIGDLVGNETSDEFIDLMWYLEGQAIDLSDESSKRMRDTLLEILCFEKAHSFDWSECGEWIRFMEDIKAIYDSTVLSKHELMYILNMFCEAFSNHEGELRNRTSPVATTLDFLLTGDIKRS